MSLAIRGLLGRGHTIDRLKSEDLHLIVEEIDQLQRNKEASSTGASNPQQTAGKDQQKQSKPVEQIPGKKQEQSKPEVQPPEKEQEQSKPVQPIPGKQQKQSKPEVEPPGKEQEQSKPDAQPPGKEQEQSKPDAQSSGKEQEQGNETGRKEDKEERKKRLHARYMRFSRSLTSACLNCNVPTCSLDWPAVLDLTTCNYNSVQ